MSQTKMASILDSIGVHICELLTIDDTPSSKPTQQALKNWLHRCATYQFFFQVDLLLP